MHPSKEKVIIQLDSDQVQSLETQCAMDWIKLRNLQQEKKEKAKEFDGKINPLIKLLDKNSSAVKSGVMEEIQECFIEVDHDSEMVIIYSDEKGLNKIGERLATKEELDAPLDMPFEGNDDTEDED